jgi:hypothetical protein
VASGFNPALIMGIVCFFNAQHHKYQVQELLGLLSKYLEVESKTLRTGPVLQEELRALKFLHKSARVHIKLEQNLGDGKENDGNPVIGVKRPEEDKEPEKATERERKRPKYSRPFTTTVPLDMSIEARGDVVGKSDPSAPIPLPQAHRQQLQTPSTSTSRGFLGDFGLGSTDGNNMPHTLSPYQTYPHVPSALQYAIKDFSFGDQDLTTYTDYSLPIVYPQIDITRSQVPTFDPSAQQPFTNTNITSNGIAPTPSPNTEANMWAAMQGAFPTSTGTAFGQVLSNMDTAGAQLGEISPPSSLGDLPGTTNLHLAMQGYEGYGYPGTTTGLGIQLGHTPTPMHAGTYYNPMIVHPQPHMYLQHPQPQPQHQQPQVQQLQPQQQQQQQHSQAMRRQSYPQPQTQTTNQGQSWSQSMLNQSQNGIQGTIGIPQTHEAVRETRSNSMWAMPGKEL